MGGVRRLRFKLHPVTAVTVVVAVVIFAVIGVLRLGGGEADGATANDMAPQSKSLAQPGYGLEDSNGHDAGAGTTEVTDEENIGGDDGEGPVVVHVTGAVKTPGVVQLPASARVAEAVDAAGGLTGEADLASVNLAEVVADGSHVHILEVGESAGPPTSTSTGIAPDSGGCVDVNAADTTALQELDGVGPKLAERILNHREANGPFQGGDALQEVPGIGPVLVERIKVGLCD